MAARGHSGGAGAVLLLCVAYVQAQTQVTGTFQGLGVQVWRTTSTDGSFCGQSHNPVGNTVCTGGLERQMVHGSAATNALPQVQDVQLRYAGNMAKEAYLSLIDSEEACDSFSHPTDPDNSNSGIQRATGVDNQVWTIPQQHNSVDKMLSTRQTDARLEQFYRLCYSCTDGGGGSCVTTTTAHSWQDSGCGDLMASV